MQENYLAKWLSGELSEEELNEFKNSDEYASFERLRALSDSLSGPDFDEERALERLKADRIGQAPKVITLNPFKKFIRVAAVIALIIGGSYFYLSNLDESVATAYAERTELTLPDDSEVFLNAGSEITYNKKQWTQNRNITLTGEAFFKVAEGKRFTVSTDQGDVVVLGTEFNVESRNDFFEVTCFEGLVSVTHNKEETKLAAGKSFMVVDGKVRKTSQLAATQPSWMHNESSFEDIPLGLVLDELQRQFNLNLETRNVDVEKRFTGTFSNTNLEMALKSISSPSKLRYTLEGNNVLFYAEDTP